MTEYPGGIDPNEQTEPDLYDPNPTWARIGSATPSSIDAGQEFEAQGAIAPGTPGWWKVWGAGVDHIVVGDLVATLPTPHGDMRYDLIAELFEAKNPGRGGFVNVEGERFTLGRLSPVVVLRRGTKNTLRADR